MGGPLPSQKHSERHQDAQEKMAHDVEEKQLRKLQARRAGRHGIWFGLGMMGTVGWSIAVPTLLGLVLGVWIDAQWPGSPISWTLALLVGGLLLGCLNAWQWLAREQEAMQREKKKDRHVR
ncbi:MAG: AtpZ/AtpI family protein [Chloroflexota bacterium]